MQFLIRSLSTKAPDEAQYCMCQRKSVAPNASASAVPFKGAVYQVSATENKSAVFSAKGFEGGINVVQNLCHRESAYDQINTRPERQQNKYPETIT